MRNRIAAALVGLLVALGLGLATGSPAQALPTDCANGTICLYNNGSDPYSHNTSLSGGLARNTCYYVQESPSPISFVMNKTSTRWFLFRDTTCSGAHVEIPPSQAAQIQALGCCGWDNAVLAVMRTSYTY